MSQGKNIIEKTVIGWREWVTLPELGIERIKAKVDTGARSSSLYAINIEYFERNGVEMVRFRTHPDQRDTTKTVVAEAALSDQRHIKSSSGQLSLRPVIVTAVRLAGRMWPIEMTLANRDLMGFRMLLGREAIRGGFLVDPKRSYLCGKAKKRRKKRQ